MKSRRKKIYILLLTLIAMFAFGAVIIRAFYYYPSDEVPLPDIVVDELSPGMQEPQDETPVEPPVVPYDGGNTMRISIPKIEVDAKVIEVGVTSKGNMAAPRSFSDVGWYKYGTFPGEQGSAVLAGHVNNGIALPAVFADLKEVEIDDDIYITTKAGVELHFKVVGHDVYDFDSAPPEVFSEDDGRYLKLITCTGTWLKEFRTHDKRLVVKAVLVE